MFGADKVVLFCFLEENTFALCGKKKQSIKLRKIEGKNISRFRNLLVHLQAKVVFRIPKNSASQCDSRTPSRLYYVIPAISLQSQAGWGQGGIKPELTIHRE